MKRLILLCSLCAVTCSVSFAQGTSNNNVQMAQPMPTRHIEPPTSQVDFVKKANELDRVFATNNKEKIQQSFDNMKQLMENEFHNGKEQLHQNNSEEARQKYQTLFNSQYAIYKDIMKMRTDLVANRGALNSKFLEFAKTLK